VVTTPWYGQRGESEPDPFTYDPPQELRGKLALYFETEVRRLERDMPSWRGYETVKLIEGKLREAFGLPSLPHHRSFATRFQSLIYEAPPSDCIRGLEVIANSFADFWWILRNSLTRPDFEERVTRMVADMNTLFRRYQCGYQAEISQQGEPFIKLIRTDSQFLHVETVRRPLSLLREAEVLEAAKQFEDAVREWSEENYADAITDANSAVETVMKFVLNRDKGTASQLIKELSKRGYLPPYMASGVSQLADLMEMLPRLRDAESDAHGKLQIRQEQLPNYARLAINLAGSLIVFLVEEWKRRKPQDTRA
jgi:hypothetical protein